MTEKEVIAYVGLTARTLRKYRKQGRLAYREVPGKTRPVIEYDKADIHRLKGELEKQRQQSSKPSPVTPALPRVTFGLPPTEYDELVEAAKKLGLTPGEYARRQVRDGLESRFYQEAAELRRELAQSNAEIRKVRDEFASAFEVVLTQVGLSPADAKAWVTTNLR